MSILWKMFSIFCIILIACIAIGSIIDFIKESRHLIKCGHSKGRVILLFALMFIGLMFACSLLICYFAISLMI